MLQQWLLCQESQLSFQWSNANLHYVVWDYKERLGYFITLSISLQPCSHLSTEPSPLFLLKQSKQKARVVEGVYHEMYEAWWHLRIQQKPHAKSVLLWSKDSRWISWIYMCIHWVWQIFLKMMMRVNQYKIGGNWMNFFRTEVFIGET